MSDYTKTTNFTAKDALSTGDPEKIVEGAEFDTEFNALTTAVNSKADKASPTLTGTITINGATVAGDATVSGVSTHTGLITMSGKSIIEANASIAAHATTMNPWSLGNYVTLTGAAVTFTALADAPQAGAEVELYMNAAHVFTDGAVFEVDGDANWTAEAGDRVLLRAKSTTVFTVHPRKKTGAPVVLPDLSITEAKLADSAVAQGKLKTALQQNSGSAGPGAVDIALTGGTYSLNAYVSSTGANNPRQVYNDGSYNVVESFGLIALVTYYFQARYISASPPNNFGDGDFELCVFAEITPSGVIVKLDVAPDTPWIYNGPNKIDPRKVYERGGKKFRMVRQVLAEHGSLKAARLAGLRPQQWIDRLATDALVEEEITYAIKNRDMNVIPSPFRNPAPGNKIVMLDPVSPLVERLAMVHELEPQDFDDTVTGLLMNGEIVIDNTSLVRATPPGVKAHAPRWKLTS